MNMTAVGNLEVLLSVDGSSPYSTCSSTGAPVNTGQWTLAGYTYDAAAQTVVIYRNGVAVKTCTAGSNSVPASIFVNAMAFQVGTSDTSASGNSYVGSIDDVRAYKRVLTANEAKALYDQ